MDFARQIAALPVRREPDGTLSVLLVTSRDTRRWVIPKGWPWPGREDSAAAAEEAREEAGVVGQAHAQSIGVYTYCKRRPDGPIEVRVTVYPLEVTQELSSWPEGDQRQRSWFTPIDAAAAVEEPELQRLLRQLGNGTDDLLWGVPSGATLAAR
jgi:8-oxo-dGTP pyrophosphatase MutT (NUDIX family)